MFVFSRTIPFSVFVWRHPSCWWWMGSLRAPAARLLLQWPHSHSVNDLTYRAYERGSGGSEISSGALVSRTSHSQWLTQNGGLLDDDLPFLCPERCCVSFLSLLLTGSSSLWGHILLCLSLLFYVLGKEHGTGHSVGILPWDRVPRVPVLAFFLSLMCIYHFSIYC